MILRGKKEKRCCLFFGIGYIDCVVRERSRKVEVLSTRKKKNFLTGNWKEDNIEKRKRAILLPRNPRNIMSTEKAPVLPFGACMIHFLLFRYLSHGWAREIDTKENLSILMENKQVVSCYVETINAAQKRLEAEVEKSSGPDAPKVYFGTPPGENVEKVFGYYSSGSGSVRVEWKETFVIISFHLGRKGFDSPTPRIGEAKIFYNNPQRVLLSWRNEHLFRGTIGDEPMEYILGLAENFLALFGQKLPAQPDRTPVPRLSDVARSTRGREQMMRF